MIAEYLRSFEAAVPMGIVSLLSSITLFVYFLWRALRMPTASVRVMEQLPLDPMEPAAGQSHEVTR
ncbi:hypothetical protein BAC2_02881 [uncultured bacterium]|nr:hypothetical protein BAC2_02881 [uncultured bacterium]